MINLSETIIYTCISMCPYPRQMPKYWEFWHTDVNRKQTERLRQSYNDSHMNELIYPGASEHLSFEPYAHTSSTVGRSDFNETAFVSGDRSHLRGRGRGRIGHFSSGAFLFAGSAFYLLSLLLLIPEKNTTPALSGHHCDRTQYTYAADYLKIKRGDRLVDF